MTHRAGVQTALRTLGLEKVALVDGPRNQRPNAFEQGVANQVVGTGLAAMAGGMLGARPSAASVRGTFRPMPSATMQKLTDVAQQTRRDIGAVWNAAQRPTAPGNISAGMIATGRLGRRFGAPAAVAADRYSQERAAGKPFATAAPNAFAAGLGNAATGFAGRSISRQPGMPGGTPIRVLGNLGTLAVESGGTAAGQAGNWVKDRVSRTAPGAQLQRAWQAVPAGIRQPVEQAKQRFDEIRASARQRGSDR